MRRNQNHRTQPFAEMPVFQNWQVVANAWYFACRSEEIAARSARSMNLCGQHVVLFRGEDGCVRALDGFCPHMGADLGIGRVKGNRIACFFHQWEFDGDGTCQRIPCGEPVPDTGGLNSYAVEEKYGGIWVFPDRKAAIPLPDYDELENEPVVVAFGNPYERSCHHHVTMINGIDVQHLNSMHAFGIQMGLRTETDGKNGRIDFALTGELPAATMKERWMIRAVGPRYGYSMRYSAGTIGLLTMMQHTKFLNRWPLPVLHMIFAYRPLAFGRTLVQPIYVTRKRHGIMGWLQQRLLLWLTKRAFHVLRDEDGKVYDNMRFNPAALLQMDRPVAVFIEFINGLTPSVWSGSAASSRRSGNSNSQPEIANAGIESACNQN